MREPNPETTTSLRRTPLHALHRALGARLVPFAGWDMPVQYPAGIIEEHRHTRAAAGLFDVSHMGQLVLPGPGAARALERVVPGDIEALKPGRMRYGLLTTESGGILDDLMVTRRDDGFSVIVNAAGREGDVAHLRDRLGPDQPVLLLEDRALLALQGPAAAAVLARHAPEVVKLPFLAAADLAVAGIACTVSRSGYTGEDGFEISVPAGRAEDLARRLLAEPEVAPVGLGARDSLRLEAGLCLHGHDIDETTSPVEAGLAWTIGARRRAQRDFPGAGRILAELADGPARRRVGLRPEGRAPLREGTQLHDAEGRAAGRITSGTFGPSVGAPVAMAYVRPDCAANGTRLSAELRGRRVDAVVAPMRFVPHRYFRPT